MALIAGGSGKQWRAYQKRAGVNESAVRWHESMKRLAALLEK